LAKTYDPTKVICQVDGNVITGYATDTFVECAFTEDRNSLTVSNSGTGTFNTNPNQSGTIKFTLLHNSDSAVILNTLALSNSTPYEITVFDMNSLSSKAVATSCKIKKKPDLSRAKEVGTAEFEYICEKLNMY
jgi:hypothetical protein